MKSTKALLAFLLLLLLVSQVLSQEPPSYKNNERLRLQSQALLIIRQVGNEAVLWSDKEASVSVLADAADVLWPEDPSQSISWLRKAWQASLQVSSGPKDEKLKAFFTTSPQGELRTSILRVARKHDPKLAEELLKQLSEQEANDKKDRGAFDDRTARSEQLLSMAQQLLDQNPEEAFALAASSLADGLSYKLQNILTSLRRKDLQLANRLFDLALARFLSSQPDPSEGQILAGYLFRPGLTFSTTADGQTILALNPAQQGQAPVATSEPERTRNFLIGVYQRLLTQPVAIDTPESRQRAQQTLILGNFVGQQYATFAPGLVPSVQGFLARLQSQLMPDGQMGSQGDTSRPTSASDSSTKARTKEEFEEKRISDLEEGAAKETNVVFRDVAYVHAALAPKPEDYLRAKRITGKIEDNDLRTDAASFVLYRAALFFLEKGMIENAEEIAPQINEVLRRSVVRVAIAQRLTGSIREKSERSGLTPEQQHSFDLLGTVEQDLERNQPSGNAARILLARTALLAKLDKDQALISLGQVVQMINKLERFDLRSGEAPNLGVSAVPVSTATVASPKVGFDFHSAIDSLVNTDFEQVAAIVGALSTKEQRGLARVEAAKLYLLKNRTSSTKESVSAIR
jgi:hypothetical protein